MSVVLVDTAPLVALCDPRHALHARALADLDRLARHTLVVCEPVLAESCFLLPRPASRARLAALVAGLPLRPLVVDAGNTPWQGVFAWLLRSSEHEPDWADGVLVAAATADRKARVWTYDPEFRTTWRRDDGSRVVLAVP